MTLTCAVSAYLHCHFYLHRKNQIACYEGWDKHCFFFLRLCRFSDSVNSNYSVTIPLPGTWCNCAVASVGARGHSGARSDFTAAELSVPQWELMYNVICQVVLSGSQKEDSIVCESPGHCHTTSLASRRDGIGKILKWSNSLSW